MPDTTKEVTQEQESIDSLLVQLLRIIVEKELNKNDEDLKALIQKGFASLKTSQARVPAPLNITEIGGYYNLLEGDNEMRRQLLASVLGLPYK